MAKVVPVITHADLTGAAADPTALVDGPKWDKNHNVAGLGNLDDTADADKPVSTAQAAADALVATNAANASNLTSGTVPAARLPVVGGVYRELLTASRTYYVRSDGSNSNTGLVNSAGGAFLTLQKAYDIIAATLDLGGQTVTVQIVDGTYAAGLLVSSGWTGGGIVVFQGNSGTPANVLISIGTGNGVRNTALLPGILRVKDCKISGSTGNGILMEAQGRIEFGNIDFGTLSACVNQSAAGGIIIATGNFTISGSQSFPIAIFGPGYVGIDNRTVTMTGTPAWSGAFAFTRYGVFSAQGCTFSGASTGARYSASMSSTIQTNGGGATYLPGNSAGSTATQGQYL